MNTGVKFSQAFSWKTVGFWLVLAMALLQLFYSCFAFASPVEFASYRGSKLGYETEWVRIYASRTLFVALVLGLLLSLQEVALLRWISVLGIVMPLSDFVLAYQSSAPSSIIARHLATIIYLVITVGVLTYWLKRNRQPPNK
jgi:Domain of unknown function (DUF4267)